ncbi:hypothetical protein ACJ73_00775 [Blastomyces percursus]|uniref:Uncharacterized protein n=1 Tax=Blastomyces percursus TaxID=1658174 RepID=A0A1J9QH80_9EURO|nr:hypothetical protein ACJ73_00775 [Blastomyces percursus]
MVGSPGGIESLNRMDCGRFRVVDSKGGEGSVDHTGLTADKRECATTHSRWIREHSGFGRIGRREWVLMEYVGRGMEGGDGSRGERSGWVGGSGSEGGCPQWREGRGEAKRNGRWSSLRRRHWGQLQLRALSHRGGRPWSQSCEDIEGCWVSMIRMRQADYELKLRWESRGRSDDWERSEILASVGCERYRRFISLLRVGRWSEPQKSSVLSELELGTEDARPSALCDKPITVDWEEFNQADGLNSGLYHLDLRMHSTSVYAVVISVTSPR